MDYQGASVREIKGEKRLEESLIGNENDTG
jgi:hypothetical protein